MKFTAKLLAVVLAGLAFSAHAADPIKIGAFLSTSGPAAFWAIRKRKCWSCMWTRSTRPAG